jgi:translation initiation factor 1 (eIF-1/SUI1)
MPTAPTSPKSFKATTKARKPASARSTSAKRTSTRGTTQAKATHAKGARTRATHQAEAAVKQAQTATRETADVFGDYAERAVLIPVGAALIARERIVSTVNDTVSTYASPSKTQAQLRRFERRGVTARSRLEREVRKARVRVERELRQRRRKIESTVSELEERRDSITKSADDLANRVPELANKVQERILSLV